MNNKSIFLLVLTIGSVCLFAGAHQDQPETPKQESVGEQEIAKRVDQLESRVAILEGILFSTAKLEKNRAQRLLEDRKNRLKNSRALFAKGMITESELRQDRMRVDEAEREMELANAESKTKQLASELELAEAERKLRMITDLLANRRNMARRGYASKSEVERLEKALDEAKLELENAKLKLDAANKLELLNK